jgi:hypothetical protein
MSGFPLPEGSAGRRRTGPECFAGGVTGGNLAGQSDNKRTSPRIRVTAERKAKWRAGLRRDPGRIPRRVIPSVERPRSSPRLKGVSDRSKGALRGDR